MLGVPVRIHKHKCVVWQPILAGEDWASGDADVLRRVRLQQGRLDSESTDDDLVAFNDAPRWGVIKDDYEEYKITGVLIKYLPSPNM